MLLHNFRLVCRSWKSVIHDTPSKFIYRAMSIVAKPSICANDDHNVPLLMLPEPENEDSLHRRFYSIAKRKVVLQVELPPSASTGDPWNKTKYLSSYGWLLSISEGCKELLLVNPFTGATIKMPTITYKDYNRYGEFTTHQYGLFSIERFILSANPSTTSDFMAAVVFLTPITNFEHDHVVTFWRNGDDNWVQLDAGEYVDDCVNISFYLGEFYGLSSHGDMMKFGTGHALQEAVTIGQIQSHEYEHRDGAKYFGNYLVESGGRLLMVRQVIQREDGATKLFRIFEVNVEKGNIMQIRDLDNRAIFIGSNTSFSVKPSHVNGCKTNCIYYTQFEPSYVRSLLYTFVKPRSLDMGVYNVTDGKFEHYIYGPNRKRVRTSTLNPHMWVESPGSST